jgi:hypothetical protein
MRGRCSGPRFDGTVTPAMVTRECLGRTSSFTRCLAALLLLASCHGRKQGSQQGGSDASMASDASSVARSDDASADAEGAAPSSSSRPVSERIRRAREACAKPSVKDDSLQAGYALLAEGKRAESVRALHDAIRAPASPIAEQQIRDGLPSGYEAVPGANGWAIASKNTDWSYVFRNGTLVRRFRGHAEFIPGTDLIRVSDGTGTTFVRVPTADVVFRSVSTDAIASRTGAVAVVHTRCDGGQELVVFVGASSARSLAMILDTRNEVPPSDDLPSVGWVDDDHVWLRGAKSSVVYDVTKSFFEPPPKDATGAQLDWGVVTPRLDPKRTLAVAHYGTPRTQNELSTALIDWQERRVLRTTATGPHGTGDPTTRFSDDGKAFALRDGNCEIVLFRTSDLTFRRIPQDCGGEAGKTKLVGFRFWPRPDTLFIQQSTRASIFQNDTGKAVASYPISPVYGHGQFLPDGATPDGAFVIDDCVNQGARSKQIQVRVGRDLRVVRTERPGTGTCAGGGASMAKSVCNVETIDAILPHDVCGALRSDAKEAAADRSPTNGPGNARRLPRK